MISNVCQVSKTSNHAKDLRKSSDDIRHYLVKTNNKVLTEICQSLFPKRGGSDRMDLRVTILLQFWVSLTIFRPPCSLEN